MSRLALLLWCLVLSGPVPASASGIPLPAEWEGIWTSVDSLYFCPPSTAVVVSTRTDTLCAGEEMGEDPAAPNPFSFLDCTGSADASHIQTSCLSSGPAGEGCILTYSTDLDATRTGETAFSVRTTQFTWSTSCSTLNTCGTTRSHLTRIHAGPLASCAAVPTKASTWGNLRARYR